ncbi:MAG TPA: hypothetical protein PKI93_04795 [Alphaproteobacteria bacterium]|nr:hypothetical protein [Alphaproteobacteria bacterium]HNS44176.1 hypothetical protein [Alphaproteobacteria bacterium]
MVSSIPSGRESVYATIRRLESSTAQFGLSNTNSSKERIAALQNVNVSAEPSAYTIAAQQDASNTEFGLTHKNTSAQRLDASRALKQRVIDNHGFQAKESIKAALTHNTKIVNIPPDQRGTIADLSA